MRKLLTVAAVIATMFLGAGAAAADPATYSVSKTWRETYVNGTPTLTPHIEDDVVEVRCHGGDQMVSWKINNPALNGGAWWRVDHTGIQVEPEWTGEPEKLRLTAVCRRG